MIDKTNYLNAYHVFQEIIGDIWLVFVVSMVAMTWVGIKYRLDWRIILMFDMVMMVLLAYKIPQLQILLAFICIGVGFLFGTQKWISGNR